MGCEEIRDLLALYAGGESYDHERIAVEAHVAVCGACARELDLFREARANLASLREGAAPAGTFKSLWSEVRTELFPHKTSRRLAWIDAGLRYAAVAMVGVAIGVLVHHVRHRGSFSAETPRMAVAPVTVGAPRVLPAGLSSEPASRLLLIPRPASRTEPEFYLPRVDSIPADGQKDF